MRNKILSSGIALAVMVFFLLVVLSPKGCGFNMLPYSIDMALSNGSDDAFFIKAFDILFSVIIFILTYWVLTRLIRRRK